METEETINTQKREIAASVFAIPGAIVIAGIIIAGAVMYVGNPGNTAGPSGDQDPAVSAAQNVKPVSENDHIKGSFDAEVTIIEFSDLECPFCKRFHETAEQVVEDYDGRVAWVYRQFPLDSLHRKARAESIATECVARLGGNDNFWTYLNRILEVTPSNDGLDLNLLLSFALELGIDEEEFVACVGNEEIGEIVQVVHDMLDWQQELDRFGQHHIYALLAGLIVKEEILKQENV